MTITETELLDIIARLRDISMTGNPKIDLLTYNDLACDAIVIIAREYKAQVRT